MLYRTWGSSKDEVYNYTSSMDSDVYIEDEVKLTLMAHVIELQQSGYINKEIACKILTKIKNFKHNPSEKYEDIHEELESYLIKTLGDDGGWIGLGRSRNDHIATALRLKMRKELLETLEGLNELRAVLIEKAGSYINTPFPTFTHLQQAQPSTFAHYLTYIVEEVSSRWRILFEELKNVNRSPLGSGAVVGTNVKLDRQREAEILGFNGIVLNTLSGASSRADLVSAVGELTSLMVTLSKIAEDMIVYTSIGIVKLPDSHISTSSLMPQKRNPVTMEILRARAGECIGELVSLLTIYKATPSGYNLDYQEMNRHYWRCTEIVKSSLDVLISLFQQMTPISDIKIEKLTLATDEAELLSMKGIPYRRAYFDIANKIKNNLFESTLKIEDSIKLKATMGSPSPQSVLYMISEYKKKLEEDEKTLKDYEDKINSGMKKIEEVVLHCAM